MSETENDPARLPMLFPDPVIEFYMQKIDRVALREHLKKSPEERLQHFRKGATEKSEREDLALEEAPPWPARKKTINMGGDPAWFAEAKAVPLLVPDPVVEAYLEDVDRGLIRQALQLTVPERFERFQRLMQKAYEFRRACAEELQPDKS